MAIFLSSSLIEQAVKELIAGGYPDRTPTAVVYRASWDDEIVIRSNLKDITEKANAAGIKRQALILVGSALNTRQAIGHYSRLYDEAFSHGYRNKGL
jgi:precorrin-4/cobalt-precorrin-4 C11-methyltransferase